MLEARDRLWAEYLDLQSRIVAALRAGKRPTETSSRLGDWATLATVVAGVLWPDFDFCALLDRLGAATAGQVLEDDLLVQALHALFPATLSGEPFGVEYTSAQLNERLSVEAVCSLNFTGHWPYDARGLGLRLRELLPILRREYRVEVGQKNHANTWMFHKLGGDQ